MACKMQCPSCEKMLKEQGDEGKEAQGEYVVIGVVSREIQCCECKYKSDVHYWNNFEMSQLKLRHGLNG